MILLRCIGLSPSENIIFLIRSRRNKAAQRPVSFRQYTLNIRYERNDHQVYKNDKTIYQLRKEAGMTRKEIFEEYGVPITSLFNWEKGISRCPDYVEAFLKEKLQQETRYIMIRKESRQKSENSQPVTGYAFYTTGEVIYEFYQVEEDSIPESMIKKIMQLQNDGWKIIFKNE